MEEGQGGNGVGDLVVQESWAAGTGLVVRERGGRQELGDAEGGEWRKRCSQRAICWKTWFYPHISVEDTATGDRQNRSIRRQSPGSGVRVNEARDSLEPGATASFWQGLGEITASLLLERDSGHGLGNRGCCVDPKL